MNIRTVLLIDDDKKLGKLLSEYFSKFDINLITEINPLQGIGTFKSVQPDLVILDVMLPDMDGFEVCEVLRKMSNVPILMLTARGDVNDRVTGLAIGADDYLPKPFDPRELVVRVETILTRIADDTKANEPDLIQYRQLTINKKSHEVEIAGRQVDLTTKEYALLLLMSEHPGHTYSRDDIMNELSGIDSELFSRSVDILISRLRNKLKPLDYIKTVWGIGYSFNDSLDSES